MTQAQFARRISVTQSYLSALEHGEKGRRWIGYLPDRQGRNDITDLKSMSRTANHGLHLARVTARHHRFGILQAAPSSNCCYLNATAARRDPRLNGQIQPRLWKTTRSILKGPIVAAKRKGDRKC